MTTPLLELSYGVKIPGLPKPKGSMKCIGRRGRNPHTLVEQVNNRKWRRQVKDGGATLRAQKGVHGITGPLGLSVTFTLPRPDSHYGSGRNAHRLLDSAPDWPAAHGTGDVDKLCRLVFDAWQHDKGRGAGVFADDAQIVNAVLWKCYPDTRGCPDRLDSPGALIRIYPIGE